MVFRKNNIPWNKGKKNVYSEDSLRKMSEYRKKHPIPNSVYVRTEETLRKLSNSIKNLPEDVKQRVNSAKKGVKRKIPRSKEYRKKMAAHNRMRGARSEITKERISHALMGRFLGENACNWKGGKKIWVAKLNQKRRGKGFVLLTKKNRYTEPIEYHHVHPDQPYVVPCPTWIHQTFKGKTHFQNVNAMLGFTITDFPVVALTKHYLLEGDLN